MEVKIGRRYSPPKGVTRLRFGLLSKCFDHLLFVIIVIIIIIIIILF